MRLLILFLLFPLSSLLGSEALIPEGQKMKVSWGIREGAYGVHRQMVLSASYYFEGGKDACKIEWYASLRGFKEGYERSEVDAEELSKVFLSAIYDEPYEGSSVTDGTQVYYECVRQQVGYTVRVSIGEKFLDFTPDEVSSYARMFEDALAAREWYRKLATATSVPEQTEEARPPFTERIGIYCLLGTVDVEPLRIEAYASYYDNGEKQGVSRGLAVGYGEGKFRRALPAPSLSRRLEKVPEKLEKGEKVPVITSLRSSSEYYRLTFDQKERSAEMELLTQGEKIGLVDATTEWTVTIPRQKLQQLAKYQQQALAMNEQQHAWLEKLAELLYTKAKPILTHNARLYLTRDLGDKKLGRVALHVETDGLLHVDKDKGRRLSKIFLQWPGSNQKRWKLNPKEIMELARVCEAAAEGKIYKGEVGTENKMYVQAVEGYGHYLVKVRRGEERAVVMPEVRGKLLELLQQAEPAASWYLSLYGVYKSPPQVPTARPLPQEDTGLLVDAYHLSAGLGKTYHAQVEMLPNGEVQEMVILLWKEGKRRCRISRGLGAELYKALPDAIAAAELEADYTRTLFSEEGEQITLTVAKEKIMLTHTLPGGKLSCTDDLEVTGSALPKKLVKMAREMGETLRNNPQDFMRPEQE
ncbi:hypothetical protein SAMN02745181_0351 [Rubritalea squalenifaciens DSM 18772]|uniref:Uncharacterized protein n=1 Tax=Rubritalea squalenifaciens DSM 18772 TaxID=1123071 RepID=A0A1M6C0I9_9BACT|nr:hypothetical protein [Rubritalea squalenifaciens]SHI54254.1 hypothetical protein SAMN02745181_0351 [Rubritalea squalenifaciens DSM 18772]